MRLKKGDHVVVITGKDFKKKGVILQVKPKIHKVRVEGVNIQTKHVKPSAKNQEGGVTKKEGFIDISNVMLSDIKTTSPTKTSRIKYGYENNKKVRIAHRSNAKLSN